MTVSALPKQLRSVSAPERPSRWQPTRAGVLNVWRYYDEVFTFHCGRLLLRGPNGTGKSKALEVLLPFLFDASLRPHRLSTFGGSERTMHWNLMGEGATGVTRVGYVWLEFRSVRDGAEHWYSIGARLQATARTTSVEAAYFTLRGRIGAAGRAGENGGVSLVNDSGQPLTRAALAEALAGRGEVHNTADEYRAAVRQTLFPGLTEQRYNALITALLQLRTPKLSERLDPALLSSLLSRALPPLDQGEISELADGFERLDRQREDLVRLDEQVRAAETLAERQKTYARRVLRADAAGLIAATTEMDNRTRAARETDEAYEAAVEARTLRRAQLAEVEVRGEELTSRIEVLTDSDDYKAGRELDLLRTGADEARKEAEARQSAADGARAAAEEDAGLLAEAEERAAARSNLADEARTQAVRIARSAGLASACAEITLVLEQDDEPRARLLLHGAVRARLDEIATVRKAVEAHEASVRERAAAESLLEESRAQLAGAGARRVERAESFETAVVAQANRLRTWARGCTELVFDEASLDELADSAAYEPDILALVEAAARAVSCTLTTEETVTRGHRGECAGERDRRTAEVEQLRGAEELPPEPPRIRTADRGSLPGAPLWKLLAFHEGVPAEEQAAVEAALEAGGLLDAWVGPTGGLLAAGHDTFAEPEPLTVVAGRTLADVLRPESGDPTLARRVELLLRSIAYGETLPAGHPAAVGADGTWRLAAATGSWAKSESAHIGATARERARARRIAELAVRIDELDGELTAYDRSLAVLAERRGTLDLERRTRPEHEPVDRARRALDRADADLASRDDAVRAAVSRLAAHEARVATALSALDAAGAERALPTERAALERLADSADAFRENAGQWLAAAMRLAADQATAAEARRRAGRSQGGAERCRSESDRATATARARAARLEEAEQAVGTSYQDVLQRIGELRAAAVRVRKDAAGLRSALMDLEGGIGELKERRTSAQDRREAALAARDIAARSLRVHIDLGLDVDAAADLHLSTLPGAPRGVTAILDAARTVAARWPSEPHAAKNIADALNRLAETHYAARQALSARADLVLEPDGDVHLLRAAMDGANVGASQLCALLTEERDQGRDDITSAERELFDQTLTGDTRRHLAARIRQAHALVDEMNARLERVRTASRVAVRLVWQIDPSLPPGTKAARDLLLKDPVRMTETDREALHRFFRDRVEEAKAAQTSSSWEDQLAQVLDYTAWHQFVVKLDRANGQGWQLLTKKLHGALSGGEKAIALHLPLFAAVAAHYHAVPEAPRLILLDEVFVGVDSTNRGQVFDLLASLDLDLLLTSDHEWCTYRELDGIAVHQLIADSEDDAVTTARFVWDGVGLVPDEGDDGQVPDDVLLLPEGGEGLGGEALEGDVASGMGQEP